MILKSDCWNVYNKLASILFASLYHPSSAGFVAYPLTPLITPTFHVRSNAAPLNPPFFYYSQCASTKCRRLSNQALAKLTHHIFSSIGDFYRGCGVRSIFAYPEYGILMWRSTFTDDILLERQWIAIPVNARRARCISIRLLVIVGVLRFV